jgi:very-short-patch-repair endonuclease
MTRSSFPNGVGREIKRIIRERDRAAGRRPPGPSITEDELAAALSRWSPFYWTQEQKLGDYRADFFCPSAQLVVEVDGSSHDGHEAYDHQRDAAMAARGLETLRFPVRDIERNAYAVVLQINRRCAERSEVAAERSLTGDDPGGAFSGGSHSARIPRVRRTDAPSDMSKPPSKSEFRCGSCERILPVSQRDSIQGYCRDCV